MTAQQILSADMLDILFESRNKAYGAYAIRKMYTKHMYIALAAVVVLFFSVLGWTLLQKPELPIRMPELRSIPPIVELIHWEDPKTRQSVPPPTTAKRATKPDYEPRIVPDEQTITQPVPDRTDAVDYVPGPENSPASGTGGDQMVQPGSGGAASQQQPERQEAAAPVVFQSAEVMPSFPGGTQALYRYLQRMLRVPDELEPGDRRTVQVRFVVNATGEVTGIEILRSAGAQFDREVIRVVERMPRWKPGSQNGRPVSVYFTQPVTFTAGND